MSRKSTGPTKAGLLSTPNPIFDGLAFFGARPLEDRERRPADQETGASSLRSSGLSFRDTLTFVRSSPLQNVELEQFATRVLQTSIGVECLGDQLLQALLALAEVFPASFESHLSDCRQIGG